MQDLLAAERIATAPELMGVTVYHCQQAVEKALKGFLSWHDHPFQRTHDLVLLVRNCEGFDNSFAALRHTATVLTPYVTEFRCPGDVEQPTEQETVTALQLAR